MSYLLDTNTFITAKKKFYAYDIVPTFWQTLLEKFHAGTVKIIDAVEEELLVGDDDLADWIKKNIQKGKDVNSCPFVIPSKNDVEVITNYQTMANKIFNNQQYSPPNKQKFFSGADPWLVASAEIYNGTVVTFEEMPGANSKKIKIPDVCQQMNVRCMDLYEMMRAVKFKI